MAVGSGLSATVGFATETTVGTPVAVTRFEEFDSANLGMKKHTVQGAGLRGGAFVRRAARRALVSREAGGDVMFDVTTNTLGLVLQHMLGSFATVPVSLGGGLYQQVHNIGSLQGKSFTTQLVKPDTTGVLGPQAFTYPGCKISSWEVSTQQNQQLKLKFTVDALDEATPSNGFATTTLSAAVAAGVSSLSTAATIPAGSYVTIGVGLNAEVLLTGTPSGTGPFTIPLTKATIYAHAAGVSVGSATGVNYGAAVALQTASYTPNTTMFTFLNGSLAVGGVTSVVGGVFTTTGSTVAPNVRTVSIKGTNPLKSDRWGLGQAVRSEQLENNWRDYACAVEIEYASRYYYDVYAADAPLSLVLNFAAPNGAILSFFVPVAFQEDGASPDVTGPEILIQKLAMTILDDGVNGSFQVVYTSTDVAV